MPHPLFPGLIEPVTALQVCRAGVRLQTLEASMTEDELIAHLAKGGHYGALTLKPVTRLGVQSEPTREIHVPTPDDGEDAPVRFYERTLDQADRARERAEVEMRASLQAQAAAEVERLRSESAVELSTLRAEREALRTEVERLRYDIEGERRLAQARISAERESIEAAADAKVRRARLETEEAEARAKLLVQRAQQEAQLDVDGRVQQAKLRLDAVESERARLAADLDQLRRDMDRQRTEWRNREDEMQRTLMDMRMKHAEQTAKLQAQVLTKQSEFLGKAVEYKAIAESMSGVDDTTKGILQQLVQQEHGIAPPSTTDRIFEMLQAHPQITDALWGALQKAVASPTPAATAGSGGAPNLLPEPKEL